MNSIFKRTSIRKYTDRKVEEDKIEKLLRAAMQAPSAGNQQPWEFYVVTDPDTIARLALTHKYSGPCAGAPLVIVPCMRSKDVMFEEHVQQDISAATENLLLEATELGLGACWMGIAPVEARMKKVEETLHMPSDLHAFALVSIGYPVKINPQKDRYDITRIHRI